MKRKAMRKKKESLELDINSLLDILVILLVFLIKSYDPAMLKIKAAKGVRIPVSKSQDLGSKNIILQYSIDRRLYVEDEYITKGLSNSSLIVSKLKEIRSKQKNPKMVNLMIDRKVNYDALKKLMDISKNAGFSQFKFIVKGHF